MNAISIVSDLYTLVKQYNRKSNPKAVNSILLKDDGTPKVFYGISIGEFTIISPQKQVNIIHLSVIVTFKLSREGRCLGVKLDANIVTSVYERKNYLENVYKEKEF